MPLHIQLTKSYTSIILSKGEMAYFSLKLTSEKSSMKPHSGDHNSSSIQQSPDWQLAFSEHLKPQFKPLDSSSIQDCPLAKSQKKFISC